MEHLDHRIDHPADDRDQRRPRRPKRRRRGALVAATLLGLAAVAAPAGAAVIGGGGHATASASCRLAGVVAYQGAGFSHVRFSSYVHGVGWITGSWRPFQRTWDESPVYATSPTPTRGRTFAVLAEYAVQNPVTGSWTTVPEWLPMDTGGFWCTVR